MVTNAVAPDQLGGLQRYVRELASALVNANVPVTVIAKAISPDAISDEHEADGVRVIRFGVPDRSSPIYALGYPVASMRAVSRALTGLAGLRHVHYPLQGIPVSVQSARYVHTFHAPIYREILPERRYRLAESLKAPLKLATRGMETLVARRASGTVVLSEYMRSELRALAPQRAARAALIPTGLDTDLFSPGRRSHEHRFANAPGPLIFTARRFVPRTGVLELIEAMREIVDRLPTARLAIAGDGQLRGAAEATVVRLGLSESVLLLGRISDEELVDWYRASTLFVLPTQELEGFGISTVEALSCGTPAVGTPVGSTPEVLGSLDPRLISDGTSPGDLARVVFDVLTDQPLLESAKDRARSHVVPRMSWSSVAAQHLEFYQQVLEAGGARVS